MKKLLTLSIIAALTLSGFAQAPQRLSYQAVIRNSSGGLVTSHAVGIKISILQGSPSGTAVYVETHTVTTNANGLATIEIGGGSVVSGTFAGINWGSGTYHLKTETDPAGGTSYTITGTSQLLSVPYALYAKQVEIGSSQWSGSGPDIYFNTGKVGIGKMPGADSRQFQVLTGTYQAIAGVNNSTLGTIYAQNSGSGPAADFRNKILIVDGTQGAGKVLTSDAAGYTSWQIPAVVTDASFTGTGTTGNPLKLASFGASTGQVLKWTGTAWDNAADERGPWSETTNYIYNAEGKHFGLGINVPTQKLTLADGGNTCYMNIQNSSTGYTPVDGMYIGTSGLNSYVSTYEAGSLYLGTTATVRLAILSDGKVGIGTLTPAYKLDVKGAANLNNGVTLGPALLVNGTEALWHDGTYFSWGYGGTWNYFKDAVGIDCQPGEGHMLAVNGVASKPGGGTWTAFSDIRLKDIHGNYDRGLEDIIRLEPVRFNYKNGNPLDLPSAPEYVGFVAQEVQKIFPEAVTETPGGYLEFDMHMVNVAVVNALKELNEIINNLELENSRLKSENENISSRLEKLEAKIGK